MTNKVSLPPNADVLAAAYDKHLAALTKLSEAELLARLNFDVATAVSVVLGAQPALLGIRSELLALPGMKPWYLDDLESVAHAALYAHMQTFAAPEEASTLPKLTEDARAARKTLHGDAVAAINHGLLAADSLDEIPMGNGRLQIAQGLLGLGVVFRAAWNDVKGKSAVTMGALDEAARLGVALLTEVGRDENPTTSKTDNSRETMRLRACSLLAKVYDECRRGVSYVRWHEDDLNDFAPPLSGPRAPRPRATGDDPANPVDGEGGGPKPGP